MGAVIDLFARSLPADVPIELLVAWVVWLLGGLLLMLWFTRRSGASQVPPVRVAAAAVVKRSAGTQPVAKPPSGTRSVGRPSSGSQTAGQTAGMQDAPPAPGTYAIPRSDGPIPDAYSELSLLLDSVEEQSRSNR